MGLDFVAIEFSFSERDPEKSESVNMVRIRNGKVVASDSYLINTSAPLHTTSLHQLSLRWEEALPRLVNFVRDDFVVSNDALLASSLIRSIVNEYRLRQPHISWFSVAELTASAIPVLAGRNLRVAAKALGIPEQNIDGPSSSNLVAMVCVTVAELSLVSTVAEMMSGYNIKPHITGAGKEFVVFQRRELPPLKLGVKGDSTDRIPNPETSSLKHTEAPNELPMTRRARREMESSVRRSEPTDAAPGHKATHQTPTTSSDAVPIRSSEQALNHKATAGQSSAGTERGSSLPRPQHQNSHPSVPVPEIVPIKTKPPFKKAWWILPVLLVAVAAVSFAVEWFALGIASALGALTSLVALSAINSVLRTSHRTVDLTADVTHPNTEAHIAFLNEVIRQKDISHFAVKAHDDANLKKQMIYHDGSIRSLNAIVAEKDTTIASLRESQALELVQMKESYDLGLTDMQSQGAASTEALRVNQEQAIARIQDIHEQKMLQAKSELRLARKSVSESKREVDRLRAALLRSDAEIDQLKVDFDSLGTQTKDQKAVITKLRKELVTSRAAVAGIQDEIGALAAHVSSLMSNEALKQQELDTLIQSERSLKNEHGAAIYQLEVMKTDYGRVRSLVNKYNVSDILKMEEDRDRIAAELAAAQEELDAINVNLTRGRDTVIAGEVGLYDFDHAAQSSVKLSRQLTTVRDNLKMMVREKTACTYSSNFTFNGSLSEGKKFSERMMRIMLTAYNAEAENAVKSLRSSNNSYAAQMKINKSLERVTKNGEMVGLRISDDYHALKIREVEIASRHLMMLKVEREAESMRREEEREERRAAEELREANEKLVRERQHYINASNRLAKKGDMEGVARMQEKIVDVDEEIANVKSRLANTKAGHVYIISNIGAFGKGIVKIGMSRRLEPMDRVKELGGASVPFRFDTHALFFADDAVAVESMLHKHFADKRVNRVNLRREFFYTTPSAVLEVLKEHDVELVEFNEGFEAYEYHTSQEIIEQELAA